MQVGVRDTIGGFCSRWRLGEALSRPENVIALIVWVESLLFPSLAWVPLPGETPLFGHALSGVFPIINGNTVGLFGAVLCLAHLPRLYEPPALRPRHLAPVLIGLASVIFSYSRISLLGLLVAAVCSLVLLKRHALVWAVFLCLALVGTSERARAVVLDHLARGRQDRTLDTFASHRLEMWDQVLSDYRASLVGRGYAAGFRYDDDLEIGHAHNSLVEVYFNVGFLGLFTWLFLVGTVCRRLWFLLRSPAVVDYELVSIAGVMIFLLVKALASTVFVHLDAGMLILAGTIVYLMRQPAAFQEGLLVSRENDISFSY